MLPSLARERDDRRVLGALHFRRLPCACVKTMMVVVFATTLDDDRRASCFHRLYRFYGNYRRRRCCHQGGRPSHPSATQGGPVSRLGLESGDDYYCWYSDDLAYHRNYCCR